MPPEIQVSPTTPMPRGYTFLPKGIPYKTLHTRKLTHAANQPLYIVASKNKTTLGLRAPTHIIKKVHIRAKATLTSRRLATTHRDAAALSKARACLTRLFAKMPEGKKEHVLRHGFKKESGRVGRLGGLGLEERVRSAVGAHVRHRFTGYDGLLRGGEIEGVLGKWR